MAGRNASPKPAKPRPANTRQDERRPEYESVTAVNQRKAAKDVAKLIDCLAECARDLRATRDAAPESPPRRKRSPSRTRRSASSVSSTPSFPRGNPLTESMDFTDREGRRWLVYIEGARQDAPAPQRRRTTVLPGRHLRFDSTDESRFTSLVPAGSPFLATDRLQSLLNESQPDLPEALTHGAPADASFSLGHRMIAWSARAIESGREVLAETARHTLELRSAVTDRMHGTFETLLSHRPVRS